MDSDMEDMEASARDGCEMCSVLRQAISINLPRGCEMVYILSHGKKSSQIQHFRMTYTGFEVEGKNATEFELYRSGKFVFQAVINADLWISHATVK
jgi:hypothetical protein